MGPRASQDLRSPSPIMAPDPTWKLKKGLHVNSLMNDIKSRR